MRFDRDGVPADFGVAQPAFIDVIFQLVLFFVFSLAFLGEERHLRAWLPKEAAGPGAEFLSREVILRLEWRDGETRCSTPKPYAEGGADADYAFPQDRSVRERVLPDGTRRKFTLTTIRDRSGRPYRVEYDHGVPDFAAVEDYLRAKKRRFESLGLGSPRVSVQFEREVPWQDVVNIVDACVRTGIEEVAVDAPEPER